VSYNYLTVELVLNGLFIFVAMRFLRTQQVSDARRLFLTSIAYLPLLLGALVLTKI
jgi:heme O synthase-like polyprenyltransferase